MSKLNMTPREIVAYLDEYIIGQKEAKKSIAIAFGIVTGVCNWKNPYKKKSRLKTF